MTGYYKPDLSGLDPIYKGSTTVTYFQNPQVFEFPVPVYLSSITILRLNSTDPGWGQGLDYAVAETADTAAGVARNLDPSFQQTLVKRITLKKSDLVVGSQYQISIGYQGFYPPGGVPAYDTAETAVALSPELILDLYRRVMSVEQSSQAVASTSILPSGVAQILSYDPNETIPANMITGEEQDVNTFKGQTVIRPKNGAFFKDSVAVRINGETLTKDVDYVCRGFSPTRTAISTNDSGVYNLIVINTAYSGSVQYDYHAVGGTVQPSDIAETQAALMDIVTYLNGTSYLTISQLPDTIPFQSLNSRQTNLEKLVRALLSGNPSYGATTSGAVVVRTLQTTDTKMHWWNIATLYKIPGSDSIITADAIKLRVEMPDRNLQAIVTISADVAAATTPMVISAENVLYDQGYDPAANTGPTSVPIPVAFRVAWNASADYTSGMVLQIGTVVPNLTERLSLVDLSNQDSTWQLSTAGTGNSTPDDNGPFDLPNASASWAYTADTTQSSKSASAPIPMDYLIYFGNIDSAAIASANNGAGYSIANANSSLDFTKAKTALIYYTSVIGSTSTMRALRVPVVYANNALVGSATGVYNGNNAAMSLTLSVSSTGITVNVNQASTVATIALNAILLGC